VADRSAASRRANRPVLQRRARIAERGTRPGGDTAPRGQPAHGLARSSGRPWPAFRTASPGGPARKRSRPSQSASQIRQEEPTRPRPAATLACVCPPWAAAARRTPSTVAEVPSWGRARQSPSRRPLEVPPREVSRRCREAPIEAVARPEPVWRRSQTPRPLTWRTRPKPTAASTSSRGEQGAQRSLNICLLGGGPDSRRFVAHAIPGSRGPLEKRPASEPVMDRQADSTEAREDREVGRGAEPVRRGGGRGRRPRTAAAAPSRRSARLEDRPRASPAASGRGEAERGVRWGPPPSRDRIGSRGVTSQQEVLEPTVPRSTGARPFAAATAHRRRPGGRSDPNAPLISSSPRGSLPCCRATSVPLMEAGSRAS